MAATHGMPAEAPFHGLASVISSSVTKSSTLRPSDNPPPGAIANLPLHCPPRQLQEQGRVLREWMTSPAQAPRSAVLGSALQGAIAALQGRSRTSGLGPWKKGLRRRKRIRSAPTLACTRVEKPWRREVWRCPGVWQTTELRHALAPLFDARQGAGATYRGVMCSPRLDRLPGMEPFLAFPPNSFPTLHPECRRNMQRQPGVHERREGCCSTNPPAQAGADGA